MTPIRCLLASLLLLGVVSTPATAQTVINPRKVEFIASADHNTSVAGQPAVASYELRWFASGASAPLSSASLGKPTPDGTQKIVVDITTLIVGIPIGDGYTARVAAIGPAGEGVSAPSNPFSVANPPRAATNVVLSR